MERVRLSVVQFGHDEEMEPMRGMYGALDADLGGKLSALRWCRRTTKESLMFC